MSPINIVRKKHVGIVYLNSPPLNISTKALKDDINNALEEFEKNPNIAVIVLTSKGEKAFSVGSDIKELSEAIENNSVKDRAEHENALNTYIENLEKPTIAAINGLALGGGLELALACDLRICCKNAQLGFPEIKLGLFPGGGGSERLPRLVGYSKALEMMLTGDLLTAEEALKVGLVNKIAKENVDKETIQFAEKISTFSIEAIKRIKKITKRGLTLQFEKANELAIQDSDEAFHSTHGREGIAAFLEKRLPNFSE
jgi:enoyl-CoA hydratase